MNKIVINIDRLVLNGVPPERQAVLVASLRATLKSALAEPGTAQRVSARGDGVALKVPTLSAAAGVSPRALGRAVAHGIVGALKS